MGNNLYLVGSSGTGKTTLAIALANAYGLKVLPSAARLVAAEMDVPENGFDKLLADEQKFAQYQERVCLKQIELERECTERFVSQRAFDCLAFEALYGRTARWTYRSSAFMAYLNRFEHHFGNHLIFVRPHPTTNAMAKVDGDRLPYLQWEDVLRFDGAMKFFLEIKGFPYLSLPYYETPGERLIAVVDYLAKNNFKGQ